MRRVVAMGIGLAAVVMLVACGGDDRADPTTTPDRATETSSPTATVSTPAGTPSPSIEEVIGDAYLAYWDAYSDAVLNLDASLMEAVATGAELARVTAEIESLRNDGVAMRVRVQHDFLVAESSGGGAVVVDQVLNNSFYVDAQTLQPEDAEGGGEIVNYTFHLTNTAGHWLVDSGTVARGVPE